MKAKLCLALALLVCLGLFHWEQHASAQGRGGYWNVYKQYLSQQKESEIVARRLSENAARSKAEQLNDGNDPTVTGYFYEAAREPEFQDGLPPSDVLPRPKMTQGAKPLAGSTFSGGETLAGYGKLKFHLGRDAKHTAVMYDTDGVVRGTWEQSGSQITLRFYNGTVIYRGSLNGNVLSGTASNGRQNWTWKVER
jgi:hypothetical protein